MKPSFALNITDTTIGLLHRTARGWMQVGETQLDTADLAEALGYLRGSALGLSPGGLTTKLVLPNSQIKYLELDAPGPNDADRRTQIRTALIGRTPYNVEDLVFDWSGSGSKVQVAVVPRETLDEAEAFAAEHRFNPVSFVGQPAQGDFKGEPWFGPTKLSETLLEKSEKVDRDAEAVQVTPRDLPKSHPGAVKPGPGTSNGAGDTAASGAVETDRPTRAQRRAAAAEQAARAVDGAAAATTPASGPVELPVGGDAPPAAALPTAASTDRSAGEIGSGTDGWPFVRAEIQVAVPVPVAVTVAAPAEAASVTGSQAFPEVASDGDMAGAKDDVPPAPSAASMAAFASRRASDAPATKRFGGAVTDGLQSRAPALGGSDLAERLAGKSAPPPLSRPKVGGDMFAPVAALRAEGAGEPQNAVLEAALAKAAVTKPATAFVTAPNIPGSRKRKPLPTGATVSSGTTDTRKSLTKPGGTFASSKDRGKPRYLGLILTVLLLLFLALIAAWSSFVTKANDGSPTGTAVVSAPITPDPEPTIVAEVPAVDDEMLADAQDPADFSAQNDAVVADVDPAADLITAPAAELVEVAPDPVASAPVTTAAVAPPAPEPAPVGIAATDIPIAAPLDEAQDEIFLTAIDAPPMALDPLALPSPVARTDALPLPQLEPPPFGTVYQFDADGRIRPTPEGIITPEGVRLVAGKPGVIPPTRPVSAIAEAPPAASAVATDGAVIPLVTAATAVVPVPFPSDPALAEARPRSRPAGLTAPASAQADDGALLAAPGSSRLSNLRPLARPTAILAAGEAARQSSAAASLIAQADQAAAVEAAVLASFEPDATTSTLAVRVSRKPAPRPKDMTRAVEAAIAVAVRTPEPSSQDAQPEADAEPEIRSAAPAIPTRASVAKQATYVNAINLSKINLIGVYGSKSSPYALIRQANGRYKKVKVGDSIDGGKVAAIGTSEVRYKKSGRMISLKLPRT